MTGNEANNYVLYGKAVERYFDLNQALMEFHELFNMKEKNDRSIAILGGTFLEMLLDHIFYAFLPEDEKEVEKLMEFNQPLGNFSNKISMTYCLGLIEKKVKDDLNLVRKIRNKLAHDLYASFEDEQVQSWCKSLQWHKISLTPPPPTEASCIDIFQVGVNQLIAHLNGCVSIARGEKRTIRNNF